MSIQNIDQELINQTFNDDLNIKTIINNASSANEHLNDIENLSKIEKLYNTDIISNQTGFT
jgi:hypothetical protein